jgi:undecaprenyl-diphosphatase
MPHLSTRFWLLAAIAISLMIFVAAWSIGGLDYSRDVALIHSFAAQRAEHVWLTKFAILITRLGDAATLMTILGLVVAWLAYARRWRLAISLAGIVIGGRIAVELMKLAIQRERPFFTPYPVDTVSLSFPSGHAGNSMITFLALALIAAPPRYRGSAAAAAIVTSIAVGSTRPLLGVHWPTDVIGGWTFGIAWVLIGAELSRRWIAAAKQ